MKRLDFFSLEIGIVRDHLTELLKTIKNIGKVNADEIVPKGRG